MYQYNTSRAALKSRKQEIVRCLVAFSLLRGSRPFGRRSRGAFSSDAHSRRLCQALTSLGPVFAAFGLYMSSRVDLLPVQACLELATLADWTEPMSPAMVHAVIRQELGSSPETLYPVFEDAPFESCLVYQSHRASFRNGEAVIVKILHPDLQEHLEFDPRLLPILKRVFPLKAACERLFEDATADFCRTLHWQTNLLQAAKSFEKMSQDAAEFDMLRVPTVFMNLSTPRILTLEQLPGQDLETLLSFDDARSGGRLTTSRVEQITGLSPDDLARRLCMVWLWQVLVGQQFPVQLRTADIVVLPSKQIGLTGGVFMQLPSDTKKNLWRYLIATSTDEPEQACSALLKEVTPHGRTFDEDDLQYRFREVVPFRDSAWNSAGAGNGLVDYLLVHWQLMSQRSIQLRPHLLYFYRGLIQVAKVVRQLTLRSDSFLDGLQDVRTIIMMSQFQSMIELHQIANNIDKYISIIMRIPKSFDNALTYSVENNLNINPYKFNKVKYNNRKISLSIVSSILLFLATIVLLSNTLKLSAVDEVWVERIGTIAFMVLGAFLLRIVTRTS